MTRDSYDVIVCGGGPGGIGAAIGAARAGAKTLLIERYGFLGGGATAMLVNPFMTFHASGQQIIFGVLQDIIDRMRSMEGYGAPKAPHAFDPEVFKIAAEQLCLEAGVDILYHAFLAGVRTEGNAIRSVEIATKSGILSLEASIFIDSTGDADLAAFAGAEIEKGRPEDGLSQPMTLNFRMARVDRERVPSRQEITDLYIAAKERDELQCPRENVLWFFTTEPDVIHFNTTRVVMKDATDPWQMSEAEIEARRQTWQIAQFLRREVPGFENAYLAHTAPQIGVRESRRVMGEYVLTADDCLAARKFDDCITRGSYSVDIHNPAGTGTVIKRIPPGEWYDIPFRCLIPKGFKNLLIGGRSISCTHEAHSAIRVMPIVFGIGQAAGVAAAMCADASSDPRRLPVRRLQEILVQQGQRLGKDWLDEE
jgi:ribulose 1,5-bisphosphate synthetase/thiazole synthase